jgi:hypothetical protein
MGTNRLTTKPTNEVLAAIQALDLDSVKARLMDPELGEGWSEDYADSIETAYKTYLSMLAKYQEHAEDLMLATDVDEFWHTHILQTMKYADDCQKVFGAFLHHNPHVGPRTAEDLEKRAAMAETTRALYSREFGSRQDEAWSGAVKAERAAYSAASAALREPAYSAATIAPPEGAYSAAAIRSQTAAYSAATIAPARAAYSAATMEPHAAYSAAAIAPVSAAYSAAAMKPENAAYSAAQVVSVNPAYSGATVRS